MRILLVLAGLAAVAALDLASRAALGMAAEVPPVGGGPIALPALFTFAVSAFREPLR